MIERLYFTILLRSIYIYKHVALIIISSWFYWARNTTAATTTTATTPLIIMVYPKKAFNSTTKCVILANLYVFFQNSLIYSSFEEVTAQSSQHSQGVLWKNSIARFAYNGYLSMVECQKKKKVNTCKNTKPQVSRHNFFSFFSFFWKNAKNKWFISIETLWPPLFVKKGRG